MIIISSQRTAAAGKVYGVFLLVMFLVTLPPTLFAAPSSIPKTGQTISYTTGDDGDVEKGISWPSPRFTDNSNGTVTDNLTTLIWLKDADCSSSLNWAGALDAAANLANGDCGLTDNSNAGTWRVPNVREIESLIHIGKYSPAVPNGDGDDQATEGDPFDNLQTSDYWTSTTKIDPSSNLSPNKNAFTLSLSMGHVLSQNKTTSLLSTLFVRDGNGTTPVAEVFATGQTKCYDSAGATEDCSGTGQDGELQKGTVWPIPRFKNNEDGTVTDLLSGLVWLRNANCYNKSGWSGAIISANNLRHSDCGLTDGSSKGEWRLPNRRELMSLLHHNNASPALPDTSGDGEWSNGDPFINVQPTSGYWSSTTYKGFTGNAWYIDMYAGILGTDGKTKTAYLWPVRQTAERHLTVSILGDGGGTVTSSPVAITCPGICGEDFEKGTVITLTAKTGSNSRFEGWSIAGCGRKNECAVTMSSDKNISVTFMKNKATVSSWMILLTR